MSIMIMGEKPSVSRAISAVVGALSSHKGYTEGNGYVVSWCVGHLVGLKFPNEYDKGWDQRWSFSQLPMLPEKWQFGSFYIIPIPTKARSMGHDDHRWKSLIDRAAYYGYDQGDDAAHNSLSDCRATLHCYHAMTSK